MIQFYRNNILPQYFVPVVRVELGLWLGIPTWDSQPKSTTKIHYLIHQWIVYLDRKSNDKNSISLYPGSRSTFLGTKRWLVGVWFCNFKQYFIWGNISFIVCTMAMKVCVIVWSSLIFSLKTNMCILLAKLWQSLSIVFLLILCQYCNLNPNWQLSIQYQLCTYRLFCRMLNFR